MINHNFARDHSRIRWVMMSTSEKRVRLHYLDWLRVLALFGVFVFHSVHPFDFIDINIKNADMSMSVTFFIALLYPVGMPLFFLISGASTFFALKRRSIREFSIERIQRLLLPFILGSILLTPVQAYYEMVHRGFYSGSFLNFLYKGALLDFYIDRIYAVGFNPRFFGAVGYHLWFLGFLFVFSLAAVPIYRWLNGENRSSFIEIIVGSINNPVGIFLWVIPLTLVQILVRPSSPEEHGWADFLYQFLFYVYGYILFLDHRFLDALRKHWRLILVSSIVSSVLILSSVPASVNDPLSAPSTMIDRVIKWGVFSINGWFWTILLLLFGTKYLDFDNSWLKYGKQAIMPFFLIHQPVIFVISFYVVQWEASIVIKLMGVLGGSFLVIMGIYELLVKRISVLGNLLGVKK